VKRSPHAALIDNEQGIGFEPHIWIDIGETIDVKREMLAAHASQVALMQTMYGEDLIGMVERLARMRGGQRGCEFAEAFRGCGTYPQPDGALRFLVRTLEA
jgi:LmbE family N-acetylglucosaminyl deacetylase